MRSSAGQIDHFVARLRLGEGAVEYLICAQLSEIIGELIKPLAKLGARLGAHFA
jgi:hypothetical protein